MKNAFLIPFVCICFGIANAQKVYTCYHPREIACLDCEREKLKFVKTISVYFKSFEHKTRGRIHFDGEGRDTLRFTNGIVSQRVIYDSIPYCKISITYNTNGEFLKQDTVRLDKVKSCYPFVDNDMILNYNSKKQLAFAIQPPDTAKPIAKTYFDKLFGYPVIDSLKIFYNRLGLIKKETYIERSSGPKGNIVRRAIFKYNLKGLITLMKFGNQTARIRYTYRH